MHWVAALLPENRMLAGTLVGEPVPAPGAGGLAVLKYYCPWRVLLQYGVGGSVVLLPIILPSVLLVLAAVTVRGGRDCS